jgi:hypothetical protein
VVLRIGGILQVFRFCSKAFKNLGGPDENAQFLEELYSLWFLTVLHFVEFIFEVEGAYFLIRNVRLC